MMKTRYVVLQDVSAAATTTVTSSQKVKPQDSYGCINWHPRELPQGETVESLEACRLQLIDQFRMGPGHWDVSTVDQLMAKTYVLQRWAINDTEFTVSSVLEKWPMLFRMRWYVKHFETLVGINVHDLMEKAKEKTRRLFEYCSASARTSHKVKQMVSTIEASNIPITDIRYLLLLALELFREDMSVICIFVDVSAYSSFLTLEQPLSVVSSKMINCHKETCVSHVLYLVWSFNGQKLFHIQQCK
jgi:hypothetical protein